MTAHESVQQLASQLQDALGLRPIANGTLTLNFNEGAVASWSQNQTGRLQKVVDRREKPR